MFFGALRRLLPFTFIQTQSPINHHCKSSAAQGFAVEVCDATKVK